MSQLPPSVQSDRRFATTLARGLSVLRAFRASDDGLGNSDISERTGIPKSTVSRLTFTLQTLGYLTHARRHDRYRPGPALLALGNVAQASISFVDVSGPIMQRLADDTGTLSLFSVRDNAKLLIVKTWRPRSVSSIWLEVGHRLPIVGSSSGQALLAALSEELFESTLDAVRGENNLTTDHVTQARRSAYDQLISRGYVIADPEQYFTKNIHAVSTPFHSRDLAEPVVFSSGAMRDDLTMERMHSEVGPKLNAAVKELELTMGQLGSITVRD